MRACRKLLLVPSIPDLNHPEAGVVVLLKVDVDGEMGVDVAHLVLEALGDTNDHVVDDGADGAQSGDVLAAAVVHLDLDDILGGLLEGDGKVTKILLEGTAGALDGDLAGLDVHLDCTEKDMLVSSCFLSPIPFILVRSRLVHFRFLVRGGLSHWSWCSGLLGFWFWGTTHLPQGQRGSLPSECTSFCRRGAVG